MSVVSKGTSREGNHIRVTFITVYWYNCFILLLAIVVNLLLRPMCKLSHKYVCIRRNGINRGRYSPGSLNASPASQRIMGTAVFHQFCSASLTSSWQKVKNILPPILQLPSPKPGWTPVGRAGWTMPLSPAKPTANYPQQIIRAALKLHASLSRGN